MRRALPNAALTLVLAASLAAPTAIAQPAPAPVPAPAPAQRDPNEKVCETVSQVGSRLSQKKVCATRAEWAAMRKDQKETVEHMQRQGMMACNPSASPSGGSGQMC